MVIEFIAIAKVAAPWLIAAGAAYGGTRQALGNTLERVRTLETDFKAHKTDTVDRMARMETKIDFIADHYRNK